MDLHSYVKNSLKQSADNLVLLSQNQELQLQLVRAAEIIIESYKKGGKLLIAGNGGSAADSQHIAAELVGKLAKDRTPLPAIALSVDSSFLTAVGNDYGYDFVFSRQIQGHMTENDVFLAITTSGNSANIVKALEACRKKGGKSILLSGKGGGKIKEANLADVYLIANGNHTANIQEAHIAIYHCLCFMIELGLAEQGFVEYY